MNFAVQRYLKRRFPLSRRAPVEDETFISFASGSFIHLDGGTLDLGIVRDSVLNATNDFQILGQTFEKTAEKFKKFSEIYVNSTYPDTGYITSKPITIKWGEGPYGEQK